MCSYFTFIIKLASLFDMEMSCTCFYFPGSLLEPFLWIGITLTSTSLSGTVAVCKDSLHMLSKTISPLSYFKTGWWIPSGPSDLSTPGLLIRCRASCLPLLDLVPLTCRLQSSGLGMRISLEDKGFIQSVDHLLFSPVTVIKWVRGCCKWLPPFDRAKEPLSLLALQSLTGCSCLIFILCLTCHGLGLFTIPSLH